MALVTKVGTLFPLASLQPFRPLMLTVVCAMADARAIKHDPAAIAVIQK